MKSRLYKWLVETDFWWVIPAILMTAAVVLVILDAIDPYPYDYSMWAVGCVAAMLIYAINTGPRP